MNKPLTVLVADDDHGVLTVINEALSRAGHRVKGTESASVLWQWIKDGEGDVVITDVIMPDIDGLDLLPRIKKARPELPVIVMSARKTLQTAVSAADRGAYEYLPKPFDLNELSDLVTRSQERSKPAAVELPDGSEGPLIGRSAAMQGVYRTMAKIMMTDLTVLITGESGTGKELVAKALHDLGPRRAGPFIPVNMAAMPKELVESELFGHERGAFTGAVSRRPGRFEQAQGGTLFLDEIGDMPAAAQIHLLRVLQQQEFRSVGGHRPIRADVRIIAATNQPIGQLIEEGSFREDLYYRLNVVPIAVPPLRDRTEDIGDLVEHFLALKPAGRSPRSLTERALRVLEDYRWPGNVRELENLLKRVVALYPDDVITPEILTRELAAGRPKATGEVQDDGLAAAVETHIRRYFDAHARDFPPSGLYQRVLREVERPLLRLTLRATDGNQIRAAGVLGLNRNTLRKKLHELGIAPRKNSKTVR